MYICKKNTTMILICDCGSTKAGWGVLKFGAVVEKFVSEGFNPNFTDAKHIDTLICNILNNLDNQSVTDVYFYGAGCGDELNRKKVKAIFKKHLPKAKINVYPDTLAACHALFAHKPGIACILGTGSNACVYDGTNIVECANSLGYMLGDEGGGCYIGKRLVHDYFLGLMPEHISVKFEQKYHLNRERFLKKVYQGEQPSRYLANFAKFTDDNLEDRYIRNLVGEAFDAYIENYLMTRGMVVDGKVAGYEVAFVGSVGYRLQGILFQRLGDHGIQCVKIIKNPLDGLVRYYRSI